MSWPSRASRLSRSRVELTHCVAIELGVTGEAMNEVFAAGWVRGRRVAPDKDERKQLKSCKGSRVHPVVWIHRDFARPFCPVSPWILAVLLARQTAVPTILRRNIGCRGNLSLWSRWFLGEMRIFLLRFHETRNESGCKMGNRAKGSDGVGLVTAYLKKKSYPRRATKNDEGPRRGWRRLEKVPPRVGKGEKISTRALYGSFEKQKMNPRRGTTNHEWTRMNTN